jgi:hypothetical protein
MHLFEKVRPVLKARLKKDVRIESTFEKRGHFCLNFEKRGQN